MKLSHDILKDDHMPDIGEKDYLENDFYRIFKRDRVRYAERPIEGEGSYEVDEQGQEFIVVNSNLDRMEKLRTMGHETFHHFIDRPIDDEAIKLNRHLKVLQNRQDLTAEAISLVMIFSLKTLKRYFETGELPNRLLPYLDERIQLNNDYKI